MIRVADYIAQALPLHGVSYLYLRRRGYSGCDLVLYALPA